MAVPDNQISVQELLSKLNTLRKARSRRPVRQRQQVVAQPDAVNETRRASGAL